MSHSEGVRGKVCEWLCGRVGVCTWVSAYVRVCIRISERVCGGESECVVVEQCFALHFHPLSCLFLSVCRWFKHSDSD